MTQSILYVTSKIPNFIMKTSPLRLILRLGKIKRCYALSERKLNTSTKIRKWKLLQHFILCIAGNKALYAWLYPVQRTNYLVIRYCS